VTLRSSENSVVNSSLFSRFADKEGITDNELLEIIEQIEGDQADAILGGDVYKVRVARQGEGKSGGYRVIVYLEV
jgi:hypothetical protein